MRVLLVNCKELGTCVFAMRHAGQAFLLNYRQYKYHVDVRTQSERQRTIMSHQTTEERYLEHSRTARLMIMPIGRPRNPLEKSYRNAMLR